jgi:hypothetical protein
MAADVRGTDQARTWRRSSSCTPGKNCVEIGRVGTGMVIRDSKSTTALHGVSAAPWAALLAHCRAMH